MSKSKIGLVFLCAFLLILIYLYPQRAGDTRTGADGKVEVYWRGPDRSTPGKWLPLVGSSDRPCIDIVNLGHRRWLGVFDDETAMIVNDADGLGELLKKMPITND